MCESRLNYGLKPSLKLRLSGKPKSPTVFKGNQAISENKVLFLELYSHTLNSENLATSRPSASAL